MAVDPDKFTCNLYKTFIFIQFITCLFSLASLKNLTVQESIKPVFYNLFLLCFVSVFVTVFFKSLLSAALLIIWRKIHFTFYIMHNKISKKTVETFFS